MLSMRTNWRRDELHRLDPSTDNFAWTEYHRIFCHDYIRSQVRLAMNNDRAAQAAPPEIYCYLCEARHAGDACPLTLVEKLQRFPQFYSPDAGRWYMSADKEPICVEAATTIESLQSALATARQELGYAQAETANFKACWDAACNDIADRDNRIAELEREGKDAKLREWWRVVRQRMSDERDTPLRDDMIVISYGGNHLRVADLDTALATPPADGGA